MGVGRILTEQSPPVYGETVSGYNTISANAKSISLSHVPKMRTDYAALTIELTSRSLLHCVHANLGGN